MMETDEVEETTIHDLPSEILLAVFNALPYKERANLTSVSTRWHRLIDARLGRKLFIGRPCQFTPSDEERFQHHYVPIEAIQTVGVNSCYFGEILDPTNSMNSLNYFLVKVRESLFGSEVPTFKYPYLVQNLFFDGPIPSNFFDAIVKPVKKLERLDFHLSSLCCLTVENMDLSHLSQLESFNIWGHRLTQGMFTQFYSSRPITMNLIELWDKNHFPHLTSLSMEYPFDLKDELQMTDTLLTFLSRHKATLQSFRLCVNLFITSDFTDIEIASDRARIQAAKAISRQLRLKNVEVLVTSLYRVLLHRLWVGFVEVQSEMEAATIATFRLQSDLIQKISEKNFRTLTKLTLTRIIFSENDVFTSASFTPLKNCNMLTSLFLEGMMHGTAGHTAGMTGAENLPQSLQKIEIGGITLTSEDVHYMLTQLGNLEQIFLTGVGHSESFGVTINTLREVIQARRIPKVSLYGCLNGTIPEGGISNGNPVDPGFIVGRPYGTLEILLVDDGYYRDLPRPQIIDVFSDLMEFEGR